MLSLVSVITSNAELVLGLGFNEGTGTVSKDTSFYKNDAFIKNGSITWNQGKYGNAVYLNGSSSLVISNNSSIDIATSAERFTFSAWLKPDNSSGSGGTILSKNISSSGAYPWYQYAVIHYSGGIVFYIGTASTAYICNGPKIPTAAWSHITITHNGSSVKFYTNGVLAKSVNASTSFVSKNFPIVIGDDGVGPYGFFKGSVDELRIYDEVISNTKIVDDFSSPVQPIETIPPTEPQDITSISSVNSLTFNWSSSKDNVAVSGYEISKLVNGSYSVFLFTTQVSFTDTNLNPSTQYYYKVRAKDINGNYSQYVELSQITQDAPLPPAPQLVSISCSVSTIGTNSFDYSSIDGATLYSSNKTSLGFVPVSYVKWPNLTFSVTNAEDSFYYVKLKGVNLLESDKSNIIFVAK